MPTSLVTPVLQVDANVIHKVDTSNPQNLFSMWTDNVAQGRRLENLSWRLWTRETFCVEAPDHFPPDDSVGSLDGSFESSSLVPTSLRPTSIPRRSNSSTDEVPRLSGSVESVVDDDAGDFASASSAVDYSRPQIRRQDSCGSSRSRGRERHITSDDLEKMVVSIVQETKPLEAAFRTLPSPLVLTAPARAPHFIPSMPSVPSVPMLQQPEPVEPRPTPESETRTPTATIPALHNTPPVRESISEKGIETVKEAPTPGTPLQKSKSATEVIRGFSPSQMRIVSPQIISTTPSREHVSAVVDDDAIPEPTSAPAAKQVQVKKAKFALGGSSSCEDSMSDPSRSHEMRQSVMSHMMKRKMAATPDEEGSLKSALHLSRHSLAQKKQTSFCSQLVTRTIPAPAVSSDEEDDEEDEDENAVDDSDSDDIDESAIDDDDDDSSDWEDSNEESGRNSIDDKTMFQRVDSTVHLPSRRSLITLMIQRSEREVRNGLTTSHTTIGLNRPHQYQQQQQQLQSFQQLHQQQQQPPPPAASPNDSDDAALMMRQRPRGAPSTLRPARDVPRSAAQPIVTSAHGSGNYAPPHSPRTNRRNMLSTELTESLRRHLLWERSQKTSTANAVLKRRHTTHDLANLRQYPEPVHMGRDDKNAKDSNANSYDQYLNRDAFNGYHAKGW
ncbi:hypothetical protein SEPCBS119000_005931 [Sporothrix epigloea]|uniref:Nitrogen regulatory protein areA GATA-like domain-containing protein n=1 Tax=Sporothrix epigloea TaxID=1892477 RepID=A0ABP0E4E1_9PEZI